MPAARPPDVAEQQLDDRSRADVLDADRVLGPPHRVDDRRGSLAAGVLTQRRGHREEVLGRAAADLGHEFRRVALEVPADELEHAALVLHGLVDLGRLTALELHPVRAVGLLARHVGLLLGLARGGRAPGLVVAPGVDRVRAVLRVPAREVPGRVLGVLEAPIDDHRAVGVVLDVILEPGVVLEDVVDDPAQERDVGPGPDRDVAVGHRARPGEPGIDVNDLGPSLLGLDHPLKADRVLLGHVRAHDHDAVGVLQVLLEGGGAAAAERRPQTGDR